MPKIADFASVLTTTFSAKLTEAVQSASEPGLGDGPRDQPLTSLLLAGDPQELFSGDATSGQMPARSAELTSGLWLLAGDLDRSHTISQDLPSAQGSFLHGIMHRREGDFGNAKYWFRRVGDHPVFTAMSQAASDVYGDPSDFVDRCAEAVRGDDDVLMKRCIEVQWMEWLYLMNDLC